MDIPMLKNKVVLVTGGAGLLGKAFVSAIIQNGGRAIIGDINEDAGTQTAISLGASFVKLDITSKDSIQNCLKKIKSDHGKLDATVNNAYPRNKNFGRHFFDVEYSDFCENLNLNLGGYFLISQQVAQFFKTQGHGNIVNISSIYGVMTPRFEVYDGTEMTMPVEYAAIKSALIQLTKYMAQYLKDSNIRVNSLSPGGVLNNQPELFQKNYRDFCATKGMLAPTDVAGPLLFLLSDQSQHMNGQNLIVDDGFSL
jgi:NAD(P)-dependent dehydrogenase (short-subunit alcohol dehydrogenase family)